MEYVDGPSLTEVIRDQGPLRGGSLHSLAVGVASALVAIHSAGIVHRDLKPANVLFALGSPKVIDLGIAKAVEATSHHTRAEEMVGTLAYMRSPALAGIVGRALVKEPAHRPTAQELLLDLTAGPDQVAPVRPRCTARSRRHAASAGAVAGGASPGSPRPPSSPERRRPARPRPRPPPRRRIRPGSPPRSSSTR
ncbi:protein kinase [Actinoplanes sp. NPDC051494]|uniref:protein kinase domain-containing protein n=1 Tax=Actinoplanes sp. NPDC051494 TaxID=3363907 RepID=UPI0037945425